MLTGLTQNDSQIQNSPSISPQIAAATILRRRRIRRDLTSWVRYCGFEPAKHHRLLIQRLERLANHTSHRLAFFLPPGSAKSTYSSWLFPPWLMAQGSMSILGASHTAERAAYWGRRIRNTVIEHREILGVTLSGDSTAADRWALSNGSEYYAAGVGVGIAGFRADGIIIDDPVRSREDADSEVIREKTWDWYKGDVLTRLKPNGWVLLIQTRWHEADLAGRILEEAEATGADWDVVSLPAIAQANDPLGRAIGEYLWDDDDYGYGAHLRAQKKEQPARNWSSLFQQSPAPEEGDFFKEEWLRPYTTPPERSTLNIYIGSDYAVSEEKNDFTCHIVVGKDADNRLWLLDLWRGQTNSRVWVDALLDLAKYWKPLGIAEEGGQINGAMGPFLIEEMRKRQIFAAREQFPSKHEKAIRAQSIRGRMAINGLYVPTYAEWYPAFRSELLAFPAAKHDDQVDALSLIGQALDRMVGRRLPDQYKPPKLISTNANDCNVTMKDLWDANDQSPKYKSRRI